MRLCLLRSHELTFGTIDVIAQRYPLFGREFIGADQAYGDGFKVVRLGVLAGFVEVAAGGNCAVRINNEVVADGVQR